MTLPAVSQEGQALAPGEADRMRVAARLPASPARRRSRWGTLAAIALLAVSTITVGSVLLLRDGDDKVSANPSVQREGSTGEISADLVSADELRIFAGSATHAVYWAGSISDSRLELTQSRNGAVYVRYLTGDARAGDKRATFTTVATYPLENAYRVTARNGTRAGALTRNAPGGGIAVWHRDRPTSVYLAYPGSDLLIEVFDPSAARARQLALSGDVGTIR